MVGEGVSRTQRGATLFAARCAADPGSIFRVGPGSAEHRYTMHRVRDTREGAPYAFARSGNTASILVFNVAALKGLTM